MSSLGGALPRHAAQFDHVSEPVDKVRRGVREFTTGGSFT